ncbi:MAG: NAD(P)-dependent oxidoreductase [Chloroflexi bacterium]|nr:NAD(P)-dependent oxidoreductase [Chloroflexota bacterium]
MKVLVTGATGFVASHLIPALIDGGHDVLACGHDESRLDRYPVGSRVVVDLRERTLASQLPTRIDAVIHLAQANVGFPDAFADLWEVNAGSTARLLDWARRAGARSFVFASTGSVYGPGERPWRGASCEGMPYLSEMVGARGSTRSGSVMWSRFSSRRLNWGATTR